MSGKCSPLTMMASGGMLALPKRFYRGLREPVLTKGSPLEQLAGARMADPASNKMINTTKGATWWTSNPNVASSYTWNHGGARSTIVPADLAREPDVILDARGLPWNEFFKSGIADAKLFDEALRSRNVGSVAVRNIVDPGGQMWDFIREHLEKNPNMGKRKLTEMLDELFMADNMLVKDHSVLNWLDGTPVNYQRGGRV